MSQAATRRPAWILPTWVRAGRYWQAFRCLSTTFATGSVACELPGASVGDDPPDGARRRCASLPRSGLVSPPRRTFVLSAHRKRARANLQQGANTVYPSSTVLFAAGGGGAGGVADLLRANALYRLSGLYAHNTGIYDYTAVFGAWADTDPWRQFGARSHTPREPPGTDSGSRTGLAPSAATRPCPLDIGSDAHAGRMPSPVAAGDCRPVGLNGSDASSP